MKVVIPRDENPKIKISEHLTRDYIVGKKVFLNQGIHYQSQVMPFAYSINMSIKELNEQIKEVKNVFYSCV